MIPSHVHHSSRQSSTYSQFIIFIIHLHHEPALPAGVGDSGHQTRSPLDQEKAVPTRVGVSTAFRASVVGRTLTRGTPYLRAATVFASSLTWTLIVLGFASSRLGKVTVSTPSLYSAATLSALTELGSVNERVNVP